MAFMLDNGNGDESRQCVAWAMPTNEVLHSVGRAHRWGLPTTCPSTDYRPYVPHQKKR
jgi:hypothetical protein